MILSVTPLFKNILYVKNHRKKRRVLGTVGRRVSLGLNVEETVVFIVIVVVFVDVAYPYP